MTTANTVAASGFIPGLATAWVRLYSAGMSAEARSVRLLEIESDLWEQHADGYAAGASPAATSIEMLGRVLRGMPNDIAWRFQAEGFHMNIQFPIERVAGVLLLFLILPFVLGVSISGYDTSADAWPSEFQEFAEIDSGMRTFNAFAYGAVGLLMVAGGALFGSVMRERSPRFSSVGAALLVSSGILMLVAAGVYTGMSTLANDYLDGRNPSAVGTSRAYAVLLQTLTLGVLATQAASMLSLSVALLREKMVPRWTGALAGGSLACVIGFLATSPLDTDVTWFLLIAAWLSMTAWLVVCGVWLLFGGSRRIPSMPPAQAPIG